MSKKPVPLTTEGSRNWLILSMDKKTKKKYPSVGPFFKPVAERIIATLEKQFPGIEYWIEEGE